MPSRVKMLRTKSRLIGRRLRGAVLRQALLALGQRRAAFAGVDQRVEHDALDVLRDGAGRTGRRAGRRKTGRRSAAFASYSCRRNRKPPVEVVGAAGDVGVDRARLVGAAVALAVEGTRCRSPGARTSPSPTTRASPGICRSNAGCDCTDEPCTKTSGPRGASARRLRQMASFTSPCGVFLTAQCSVPAGFSCAFTSELANRSGETTPAARNSLRSVIKEKPASWSRAPVVALRYPC